MHWFLDPITNHYVDFNGRASRQQFWMFALYYILFYILVSIAVQVAGLGVGIELLFALALFLPTLALQVRRLHDIDMSGWWLLLLLIPILGSLVILIFMIRKGDVGPNRFGADPHLGATVNPSEQEMPSTIPPAPIPTPGNGEESKE